MLQSASKHKKTETDEVKEELSVISEEQSFPRRIVPPNPINKMSQRTEQKFKNLAKRRTKGVTKPENQKNKGKENEEVDIDELMNMPPKRFYGKEATRTNPPRATSTKENELQCPICEKYFPITIIEVRLNFTCSFNSHDFLIQIPIFIEKNILKFEFPAFFMAANLNFTIQFFKKNRV